MGRSIIFIFVIYWFPIFDRTNFIGKAAISNSYLYFVFENRFFFILYKYFCQEQDQLMIIHYN